MAPHEIDPCSLWMPQVSLRSMSPQEGTLTFWFQLQMRTSAQAESCRGIPRGPHDSLETGPP